MWWYILRSSLAHSWFYSRKVFLHIVNFVSLSSSSSFADLMVPSRVCSTYAAIWELAHGCVVRLSFEVIISLRGDKLSAQKKNTHTIRGRPVQLTWAKVGEADEYCLENRWRLIPEIFARQRISWIVGMKNGFRPVEKLKARAVRFWNC